MSSSVSRVSESHPSSRRYKESFKLKAACMVLKQNHSIQKVATKLKCSPMSVRKWVEHYRDQVTHLKSDLDISPDSGKDRQSKSFKTKQKPMPFLPVHVVQEFLATTISHYEIVTRGGLTLRLPDGTAVNILAELVRELESASC